MKTLLTVLTISLFTTATFAGKKDPLLMITSTGAYVIIVDGKRFDNEKKISMEDLQSGKHYIDVFKKKKGLFGSKYKLVSSKRFELGKDDLHIDVNESGYIMIGNREKGWDGDYWWKNRNNKKDVYKDKDDDNEKLRR